MRIDSPAGVKLGRERLYKVSDASKEIGVLGEVHDEDNLWMRKKERKMDDRRRLEKKRQWATANSRGSRSRESEVEWVRHLS